MTSQLSASQLCSSGVFPKSRNHISDVTRADSREEKMAVPLTSLFETRQAASRRPDVVRARACGVESETRRRASRMKSPGWFGFCSFGDGHRPSGPATTPPLHPSARRDPLPPLPFHSLDQWVDAAASFLRCNILLRFLLSFPLSTSQSTGSPWRGVGPALGETPCSFVGMLSSFFSLSRSLLLGDGLKRPTGKG